MLSRPLELIRERWGDTGSDTKLRTLRISRHRELLTLWHDLGYREIVEIGTEGGRYAEEICRANPQAHITCVDPWLAYDRYEDHVSQPKLDGFYAAATARLAPYNATLIRAASLDAAAAQLFA